MSSPLTKACVLVIDSNPDVSSLLENVVRKLGFGQVLSANSAYDAARYLKTIQIHLVLTDYHLRAGATPPGMEADTAAEKMEIHLEGADLVKRVRRSPKSQNPFVPIIMFTDPLNRNHAAKARDSGVNEIVSKPLSIDELCDRITYIIKTPAKFITAENYKGPCRRRDQTGSQTLSFPNRRQKEIRLIRCDEYLGRS